MESYMEMLANHAKHAAVAAAKLGTAEKNKGLCAVADELIMQQELILAENQKDLKAAEEKGVKQSLIDRLALSEKRIADMAEGLRQIASLDDPVGEILSMKVRPNGLRIGQKRVPLGVVGIIYESRPNVTADAFGLCFKTGNAVILRGGSDAIYSNQAIVRVIKAGLRKEKLCQDLVLLVEDTSREVVNEMMKMHGLIDVLIPRGGGRSSGRETIGRVAAGAIASKILNELGISLCAYTKAIGPYVINETEYNYSEISQNSLYMPNNNIAEQAGQYITSLMKETNSCGGVIECIADGLPVGLGEPVFDKLDALLAQAVMSIGAVKGVEIGDGFQAASSVGSKNNDPFYVENGEVHKKTNHSGGTLGGMSDGSRLIVRAAVKPTSSIAIPQETINTAHENTEIVIHGRHDPVIVPRAVVVVEAMTAITLTDLLLQNMTAKMDHLKQIYTKEI